MNNQSYVFPFCILLSLFSVVIVLQIDILNNLPEKGIVVMNCSDPVKEVY